MASKLDDYKIDAWLCPLCSDVVTFGFARHLRDCKRAKAKHDRAYAEAAERKAFLEAPRLYSTSPFDFIRRINCALFGLYRLNVGLKIVDSRYSERLSNTHECPVIGVTNWACDKELPRGYPGYEVKYAFDEVRLDKFHKRHRTPSRMFWATDYIKQFPGFHFGSGTLKYAWSKLFIDDFPTWNKTPGFYHIDKEI